MAKLTSKERNDLPSSAFVFPKERRYPIHDKAHARNALARVAQYGTEEEKARVKEAVHKKFPGLGEADEDQEMSSSDRISKWRERKGR